MALAPATRAVVAGFVGGAGRGLPVAGAFTRRRSGQAAPERRRERQQVFNLGRGRTTVTYVLPNGNQLLGQQIWFRAEEIDGDRILNDFTIATE